MGGIDPIDPAKFVGELEISGFTMMGLYPRGMTWGWSEGGDHVGQYNSVWNVPNPEFDPVLGSNGGINELW